LLAPFLFIGCGSESNETVAPALPLPKADLKEGSGPQSAVFAGGCFWCTEAVFEELKGVTEVVSGYAGGTEEHANYGDVCDGITEHAEAIKIVYDPEVISYGQLLNVFFTAAHNPTQLNYQGPDHGTQYRSAIFYTSEEERKVAEDYIKQLNNEGAFEEPIVTTLEALPKFYPAEDYHQDYAKNDPDDSYVVRYSLPKIEKVRKQFPELVREATAN